MKSLNALQPLALLLLRAAFGIIFHVAWLSDACASNECNADTFCATRHTGLFCLHFGGNRTFWRRVAAAGIIHAGSGAVAGDRNGLADVESVYATQLFRGK